MGNKAVLAILSIGVVVAGSMVATRPAEAQLQNASGGVKDKMLKEMLANARKHTNDTNDAMGWQDDKKNTAGAEDLVLPDQSPGAQEDRLNQANAKAPTTAGSANPLNSPPSEKPVAPAPKVATIAELLSFVDVVAYPAKPFKDAGAIKSKVDLGILSSVQAESLAAAHNASLSGRRISVTGVVNSMNNLDGNMRQVLVAAPNNPRRVAYLVTMPRGDDHEFSIGKKATFTAIAMETVAKPKYKGALITAIGGKLSDWDDEGITLAQIAETYGRPVSGFGPESKAKDAGLLHGFALRGMVQEGQHGVAVFKNNTGKTMYATDGELVEPGLRVLSATTDRVELRVDNKKVDVRP